MDENLIKARLIISAPLPPLYRSRTATTMHAPRPYNSFSTIRRRSIRTYYLPGIFLIRHKFVSKFLSYPTIQRLLARTYVVSKVRSFAVVGVKLIFFPWLLGVGRHI
jgi:hypothetical protein